MEMEYVSKNDLKPYKRDFNDAMKVVKKSVNNESFYYRLIGSAKRNLVLRHHNKGFDLDYQIIFYTSIMGRSSEDYKNLKRQFIDAFNKYFTTKGYEYAEDSRSAITIKKLENNVIHHGYDVTLISTEDDGLYILKYETEQKEELSFKIMKNSKVYQSRYNEVKGTVMWNDLREKYKFKKNNNTENKKSFSLLVEAIKEVLEKLDTVK